MRFVSDICFFMSLIVLSEREALCFSKKSISSFWRISLLRFWTWIVKEDMSFSKSTILLSFSSVVRRRFFCSFYISYLSTFASSFCLLILSSRFLLSSFDSFSFSAIFLSFSWIFRFSWEILFWLSFTSPSRFLIWARWPLMEDFSWTICYSFWRICSFTLSIWLLNWRIFPYSYTALEEDSSSILIILSFSFIKLLM